MIKQESLRDRFGVYFVCALDLTISELHLYNPSDDSDMHTIFRRRFEERAQDGG